MKKILLSVLMLVPVILISQTQVLPGPVSGTWDQDGSPYMVNGEIYIEESETLSIEPGVDVKFTGWYKFIVYGSLIAEGTEGDNILFTANNLSNPWHGIQFYMTSETSVLDHCIIEYGYTETGGGGILFLNSPNASITVKNSTIRNNIAYTGGGVECTGSSMLIEDCDIIQNEAEWGGGIDVMNMYGGSVAIVRNCLIKDNNASSSGGGISAGGGCNIEIIGNTIMYNVSNAGAGIRIYDPVGVVVSDNLIARNNAWNNGGGVGCWLIGSEAAFNDNTIVFNMATNGGGVYTQNMSSPSFESDIIYFNTQQVYLNNPNCDPPFSYCNVQGGSDGFAGPGALSYNTNLYTDCIDEDPLFVDWPNDDFNLSWLNYPVEDDTKSPCIDAGCPGPFPEADGTCNDIGAYYYFQLIETPDDLDADSITSSGFRAIWSYANPAAGYKLDVAKDTAFTIWVLENQEVEEDTSFYIGNLDPGTKYYFRIRAFNTAQTSEYSDTQEVTTGINPGIIIHQPANVRMYASNRNLYIYYDYTDTKGMVWAYNLSGQLLVHQALASGSNVINPGVSDQVVILRVVIDGRKYHRKLYVH